MNWFFKPSELTPAQRETKVIKELLKLSGVEDICAYWNYPLEVHTATTSDSYRLCLQRIPNPRNGSTAYTAATPYSRPTVILMHGVGLCSDVFVCHVDPSLCLAFVLADAGFDVWMANVRGSKYSSEHDHLHPSSSRYWNFGLDEMACLDVPTIVDYVLDRTGRSHVSWIGYSQGFALACAALSVNDELQSKMNVVVGIGPALKPKVINSVSAMVHNAAVSLLIPEEPQMFPSSSISMLNRYLPYFARNAFMDVAFNGLFGWATNRFGREDRKKILYDRILSTTSSSVIKHWHQIMYEGDFQMRKDRRHKLITTTRTVSSVTTTPASLSPKKLQTSSVPPSSLPSSSPSATTTTTTSSSSSSYGNISFSSYIQHRAVYGDTSATSPTATTPSIFPSLSSLLFRPFSTVSSIATSAWTSSTPKIHTRPPIRFPVKHITVPMHLFLGDKDPVSDPFHLTTSLPSNRVHLHDCPDFSHIDFIYAHDARSVVWDRVVGIVKRYDEEEVVDSFAVAAWVDGGDSSATTTSAANSMRAGRISSFKEAMGQSILYNVRDYEEEEGAENSINSIDEDHSGYILEQQQEQTSSELFGYDQHSPSSQSLEYSRRPPLNPLNYQSISSRSSGKRQQQQQQQQQQKEYQNRGKPINIPRTHLSQQLRPAGLGRSPMDGNRRSPTKIIAPAAE